MSDDFTVALWSLSPDSVGLLSGDVSVGIKWDSNSAGEQEADVDFDIIPNANDTFTVKYVPPAAGRLTVKVLFTDQVRSRYPFPQVGRFLNWDTPRMAFLSARLQEVPQSPFMVKVEPSHDASKVKAKGPGLAPSGESSFSPERFHL